MVSRRELRWVGFVVLVALLAAGWAPPPAARASLNCTFTATRLVVNLREGPGTGYDRVGFLQKGATLTVIDQAAGNDGYVWWKSSQGWVRSDLGTSDCPPTCGNTVCEYAETSQTCARDCTGPAVDQSSATGTGCTFGSCEACLAAFPCWPEPCSHTECHLNAYGCPVCETAP